jgi:hypothetical protein
MLKDYCKVMKELFLVPVILATFIGLAYELEDLSIEIQGKAIKQAQDMVLAMDCAIEARPLTECAPDIMSHSFADEMQRSQQILADLQKAS